MKCPICCKDVAFGAVNMPFCSERCRLIDLGKWADEEYVIITPADEEKKAPEREEDE
jgi:uncharacterized protein